MDKLEDVHRRERENLQMMEERRERAYQAYRLHHLLSTKQVCPLKHEYKLNHYCLHLHTAISVPACSFPFNVWPESPNLSHDRI